MYARVTTMEGFPDKMDDATGHLRGRPFPNSSRWTGSRGLQTAIHDQVHAP
jgi:hypothetical protein